MRRHHVLPAHGTVLVSTDVHGNLEDFLRMREIFTSARRAEPDTHWVILGDVVHAPDAGARAQRPDLYDYPDGSAEIVAQIVDAQMEAPDRVHFVLGNHDHGHVGGPHPGRFHDDEVAALDARLTAGQRDMLHALFDAAYLAIVAPCGVLLTHGAPDTSLERVTDLDDVDLDVAKMTDDQARMLRAVLGAYGQSDDVCRTMLGNVSRSGGWDLRVLVHGHDRDEAGFFHEGEHQACPVIFGAPRANKRYLRLELGARYDSGRDIRDGVEILRLY